VADGIEDDDIEPEGQLRLEWDSILGFLVTYRLHPTVTRLSYCYNIYLLRLLHSEQCEASWLPTLSEGCAV
jgi:hypothetical protein